MGAIAFTALAQGLLTDRYATKDASDIGRATQRPTLASSTITGDVRAKLRGLKEIADGRGQSLAQMALAWVLRDPVVASALIGAASVAQLDENLALWPILTSPVPSLRRSTNTPRTPTSTFGGPRQISDSNAAGVIFADSVGIYRRQQRRVTMGRPLL
jgi:diketogulonate reductase-like aldo/keto reductase